MAKELMTADTVTFGVELETGIPRANIDFEIGSYHHGIMLTNAPRTADGSMWRAERDGSLRFPISRGVEFVSPILQGAGGAVIIVDKYSPDHDSAYIQTIKRRITLLGKTMSGTPPDEIIEKELSLSGVQRPLDASLFEGIGIRRSEFFRFGEFIGWLLYKSGS